MNRFKGIRIATTIILSVVIYMTELVTTKADYEEIVTAEFFKHNEPYDANISELGLYFKVLNNDVVLENNQYAQPTTIYATKCDNNTYRIHSKRISLSENGEMVPGGILEYDTSFDFNISDLNLSSGTVVTIGNLLSDPTGDNYDELWDTVLQFYIRGWNAAGTEIFVDHVSINNCAYDENGVWHFQTSINDWDGDYPSNYYMPLYKDGFPTGLLSNEVEDIWAAEKISDSPIYSYSIPCNCAYLTVSFVDNHRLYTYLICSSGVTLHGGEAYNIHKYNSIWGSYIEQIQ